MKANGFLTMCLMAAVVLLSGCQINLLPDFSGGTDQDVNRLERTLEFNPGHAHANFLRGRAALEEEEPKEALAYFRRAIASNSDLEEAWEGIGVAYLDTGGLGKAESAFEEMAEKFPQSAAAREGLATVALKRGNVEQARKRATEALELAPESGQAHRLFAEAAYAEGELETALEHWKRAMELDTTLRSELRPMVEDLEGYVQSYR